MRKAANPRSTWIFLSPRIGILYSQILLLLAILGTLVFHFAWGKDHHSQGLYVLTYLSELWQFAHTACQAGLVRVDLNGTWYLDSEKIEPNDLPNLLHARIGSKTNCIVLFDAGADVPFTEAIRAIDVIEETSGRVVLLTPKTKPASAPE